MKTATVFKIVFHKELNSVQCACGHIGTSYECTQEIKEKTKIIFIRCSREDSAVCKYEADKKEYNF